jgi:hypothetical protein
VCLLIYGYTTGGRSSRAIERKCVDDVAFRFMAADQAPDFRSIARFRRRQERAGADDDAKPQFSPTLPTADQERLCGARISLFRSAPLFALSLRQRRRVLVLIADLISTAVFPLAITGATVAVPDATAQLPGAAALGPWIVLASQRARRRCRSSSPAIFVPGGSGPRPAGWR